ncbi:MAG: DUF1343 domain-containing protein [Ignavibacteria bacterium]
MPINKIWSLIVLFSFTLFPSQKETISDNKFLLGNESLLYRNASLLQGKRIGLVTNMSGVLSNGVLFLDSLNKNFTVSKIFTPEHGLRGDDRNENFTDDATGIQIVSLYGNKKKPGSNDLEDVDVMVYDIQDVGARFYTFINTMYYCMESAVENNKEMLICDRPVIPNGNYSDGFMLDDNEKSFVGLLNVPIAYGMTCGELAQYINTEYFSEGCKLTVIKMENYLRDTDYTSLDLPWIKPSPNVYFPSSAVCYLGTCLLEGTNFAEGRGTERPFEYIGAPYCDGNKLAEELNSYNFNDVNFESISFTPQTITSPSNPPKFINKNCEGVYINVTDKKSFEPVKTGIAVLVSLKKLFPEFIINKNNFLDKLAGTSKLRTMLNNGSSYKEIVDSYKYDLEQFKSKREKYLLYK